MYAVAWKELAVLLGVVPLDLRLTGFGPTRATEQPGNLQTRSKSRRPARLFPLLRLCLL